MSMGCTRTWWLAAIDDRVKAVAGVDGPAGNVPKTVHPKEVSQPCDP